MTVCSLLSHLSSDHNSQKVISEKEKKSKLTVLFELSLYLNKSNKNFCTVSGALPKLFLIRAIASGIAFCTKYAVKSVKSLLLGSVDPGKQ